MVINSRADFNLQTRVVLSMESPVCFTLDVSGNFALVVAHIITRQFNSRCFYNVHENLYGTFYLSSFFKYVKVFNDKPKPDGRIKLQVPKQNRYQISF